MDTTPKYIKMCEKAFKDLGIPPVGEIPTLWARYYKQDDIASIRFTGWRLHCHKTPTLKNEVPLYRQDQLQGMIDGEWTLSKYEKTRVWQDTMSVPGYATIIKGDSAVQCLIQAVMHEKYGKVWNNEKEEWVE